MAGLELGGHGLEVGQVDRDRGVGAVVAQMDPAGHPDPLAGHSLVQQLGARGLLQGVHPAATRSMASVERRNSTDCSRIAVVSASPMPNADSTPAIGGISTVPMPSESATAQACCPPAPPNVVNTYAVTSRPFSTEMRLTALAMLATAICR